MGDFVSMPGQVVEFFGMPASGKTTLYKGVEKKLEGYGFSSQLRKLKNIPPISRKMITASMYGNYLFSRSHALPVLKIIMDSNQKSYYDFTIANLAWLGNAALHRYLKGYPGIQMMDQGTFQALWQIGFGSEAVDPFHTIACLVPFVEFPDLLIGIEAEPETIVSRISKRTSPGRLDHLLPIEPKIINKARGLYIQIKELAVERGPNNRCVKSLFIQNDSPDRLNQNIEAIAQFILDSWVGWGIS